MYGPDGMPQPGTMQLEGTMYPQMTPQVPLAQPKMAPQATRSLTLGLCCIGVYLIGFFLWLALNIIYWDFTTEVLIFAIVSLMGFTLGIIGVIFGIAGIKKINRSTGSLKGKGLCIAGIIISSIGLGISILIGLYTLAMAYFFLI